MLPCVGTPAPGFFTCHAARRTLTVQYARPLSLDIVFIHPLPTRTPIPLCKRPLQPRAISPDTSLAHFPHTTSSPHPQPPNIIRDTHLNLYDRHQHKHKQLHLQPPTRTHGLGIVDVDAHGNFKVALLLHLIHLFLHRLPLRSLSTPLARHRRHLGRLRLSILATRSLSRLLLHHIPIR